jgi:hypothetical protein
MLYIHGMRNTHAFLHAIPNTSAFPTVSSYSVEIHMRVSRGFSISNKKHMCVSSSLMYYNNKHTRVSAYLRLFHHKHMRVFCFLVFSSLLPCRDPRIAPFLDSAAASRCQKGQCCCKALLKLPQKLPAVSMAVFRSELNIAVRRS